MPTSKKLKAALFFGIFGFLFIFVFLPILGHTWRKQHEIWHPPIVTASGWQRFNSSEGKFSVRFPGVPESTNMFLSISTTNLEQHVFYVNPNIQNSFAIAYSDSPIFGRMAKSADPQEFLRKSQSLMVSNEQGKVVFEQESKLKNYPALEFEYAIGGKANYSYRVKLVLVGSRVYQIYVVFLTTNPYPAERAIFFNSFQILAN